MLSRVGASEIAEAEQGVSRARDRPQMPISKMACWCREPQDARSPPSRGGVNVQPASYQSQLETGMFRSDRGGRVIGFGSAAGRRPRQRACNLPTTNISSTEQIFAC